MGLAIQIMEDTHFTFITLKLFQEPRMKDQILQQKVSLRLLYRKLPGF